MQRRTFLATATAAAGGIASYGAAGPAAASPPRPVRFYSSASQVAADGTPLADADPSVIAARAEPTAFALDPARGAATGDAPIPLASVDGSVAGFGAMLVPDAGRFDAGRNFEYRNVAAVLGVWDSLIDGDTVLWDGSHGQYWTLGKFGRFAGRAAERGYRVRPASAVDRPTLAGADALVVTTPPAPFSAGELDALAAFVERGGAVVLHDQAGFRGLDETDNLNAIAGALDVAFRFNDDEVNDDANNAGAPFDLLTTRYGPLIGGEWL